MARCNWPPETWCGSVPEALRLRQVELLEQLDGLGLGLRIGHQPVADRHFAYLFIEGHGGIERGGRALGDIGDAMAPKVLPLGGGHLADVLAFEDDPAAGDEAAAPGVAECRQSDGRLAGARFADEAEHLAASQGDNLLHGYRGDTGEELTKATGETMQGLRHFVTILAAEGNLYVAADERIYAFAF